MDSSKIRSHAYDNKALIIRIDGEKVYGFCVDHKVSLKRGLNGFAESAIYLQGTSGWMPKFKKLLGHEVVFDVEYEQEFYNDHFPFKNRMVVSGYEATHGSEIPVYIFYFKSP